MELQSKPEALRPSTASPLRKNNTEVATYLANARTLLKHGETSLAFALVRSALRHDSKHPESLKTLAQVFTQQSQWKEALQVLNQIKKFEKSFYLFSALGEVYYNLHEDESALENYEQALQLETSLTDKHFSIYKNMGNVFCRMKDYHAAEESYCKAFAIDPKSDALLVNLGTLEIQRNDYEKALIRMRSAVEMNPRNDKAWVGLALVHNVFSDTELARANVRKAVDIAPDNRTAVHILCTWAAQDLNYLSAIPVLQEYLSRVEFDEEMSLLLIHFFVQTTQFEKARLELERLLLWNPNHSGAHEMQRQIPRWT